MSTWSEHLIVEHTVCVKNEHARAVIYVSNVVYWHFTESTSIQVQITLY